MMNLSFVTPGGSNKGRSGEETMSGGGDGGGGRANHAHGKGTRFWEKGKVGLRPGKDVEEGAKKRGGRGERGKKEKE